ncbi:unnamed protein product, partial [Rotaria sp. Silwood1]
LCTSMFLSTVWLNGYFQMNSSNTSEQRLLPITDFRNGGHRFFLAYAITCQWAINTVIDAQQVFFKDTFVNSHALSASEFKTRSDLLISTFQKQTANNIGLLSSLIYLSVVSSGIESGAVYETLFVNNSWMIFHNSPPPPAFNVCTCSVASECIIGKMGFQCILGNNCTKDTTVWTIPGVVLTCTYYESILTSDLRCFYDQACFDTVLSMYNVDMPDRLPLPSFVRYLPILNKLAPSRFSPTDSLRTLYNNLMVEEWNITGNFDGYYKACAPVSCTYSSAQRLNIIDLVTTIVSLIGGLTVSLRLLIQLATRVIPVIITWWQNQHTVADHPEIIRRTNIGHQIMTSFIYIKQWFSNMNLFKKESCTSQMERHYPMATVASRIYMIMFTLCIVILVICNGLDETTVTVTVQSPSLTTFEQIQAKYSTELSCPCKQIGITYRRFLSMKATYHQVCSSPFITPIWTTSLYGYGKDVKVYREFDRPFLSRQYQILGMLCDMSQSVVYNTLSNFNNTLLVTALVLSRASFESQIEVILHQLIDTVPLQFQRTITFAMELIQSNLIPTSFNTDWFIEYGNASNDYLLRFIPRLYNNDTCNCVVSSTCQEPLQIGPPNLILPGLVIGCSPMNALRISTLECMFSMNCVNRILSYLNYYTELDGSLPSNFTPSTTLPFIIHPLNQSIPSRFLPTAPIGTLIDELFIEDWQNISLYENYFAACQPTMCQYKYIQRNNILLVVTSLLGLYGGLTVSLRFLVWYGICLYRWIKFSNHVHSETAVPRINTV